MINKIKNLFLLVLCVAFIGSAIVNVSAQNSRILATAGNQSLKQSDVDKVIEFFEWAFAAKFTNQQRSQYQALKIEQFQNDPAGIKKGIEDVISTYISVRAKSETDQERLRQAFDNDFVGQLRGGNDMESRLLLSVYDSSQASNETEVETNGDGGDISVVAGKWVWSRTGSSSISTVGTYMGSNGSRFTYEFSPSGAVEFTGIMNVMQGGCNQQIFRSVRGQASLSGDTLTIRWAPEKFTRDFSCDTANNYTKTIPAKTETLRIKLQNDMGQKQLCFVGAECFSQTR